MSVIRVVIMLISPSCDTVLAILYFYTQIILYFEHTGQY